MAALFTRNPLFDQSRAVELSVPTNDNTGSKARGHERR